MNSFSDKLGSNAYHRIWSIGVQLTLEAKKTRPKLIIESLQVPIKNSVDGIALDLSIRRNAKYHVTITTRCPKGDGRSAVEITARPPAMTWKNWNGRLLNTT